MNFDLFNVSYIALWGLVLFQGLLALALLRRLEDLRDLIKQTWGEGALEGSQEDNFLPVGGKAPEFKGFDARSGKPVGIHHPDGAVALLFLSSECILCRRFAESLGQYPLNGLPPIIAVCRGGNDAAKIFGRRLSEAIPIISEGAEEAAKLYGVSSSPTSVVIGPARIIRGYGHPTDAESLRRFIDQSLSGNLEAEEAPTQSATLRS